MLPICSAMPRKLLRFLTGFLRAPLQVGTLLPSSRWVVRRLAALVPPGVRTIVEFGPGTGVITAALLERLPADGRLLAIETNPDYVRELHESFDDPRLIVEQASAAELESLLARHGLVGADLIVSGIPFSVIPREIGQAILAASARALGAQGRLLIYQYTPAVLERLRGRFEIIERSIEWRNTVPMRIFLARPLAEARNA